MKKTGKRKRKASTKPKKVTVKFFINKAVQPVVEGTSKRYPLYTLITYDRKNTMMRCHYGQYYKDLNEINKVHYPGLLAMEERIIRKTIHYQMIEMGNDFDLKGIYKKYDQYCIGIHELLDRHLKNKLWSALSRIEPFEYVKVLNFTDPDISFETLYAVAKRVYKNLTETLPKSFEQEVEAYYSYIKVYQGSFFQYSFPAVIEWIDNSMKDEYRRKLTMHYSNNSARVKREVEWIDKVVSAFLKSL